MSDHAGQARAATKPVNASQLGATHARAGGEAVQPLVALDSGALPPLLPEGEYLVRSTQAVVVKVFGRLALVLHLEIVEGEHRGERLFWAAQLPPPGRRPGIASKYFRSWLFAAGRRPQRGERLTPRMLEAKLFRVRVVTVTKDQDGHDRPAAGHYSIARDILERLA